MLLVLYLRDARAPAALAESMSGFRWGGNFSNETGKILSPSSHHPEMETVVTNVNL